MIRNLVPRKIAELLLRQDRPGLEPPPPLPDDAYLRAHLRPEFTPTRARMARARKLKEAAERREAEQKPQQPYERALAEASKLENSGLLEACRRIEVRAAVLIKAARELEEREAARNPGRRRRSAPRRRSVARSRHAL